jgi:hypothetical protein
MASLSKLVEATDVVVVLFESAHFQHIIAYGFTGFGVIVSIGMMIFPEKKTFPTLAASVLITMGFFVLCTLALMISMGEEVEWRADRVEGTLRKTRKTLWTRTTVYPLSEASNLSMAFVEGGDDTSDVWVVRMDFPEKKNLQVAQVLKKDDAEKIYSALGRVMGSSARVGKR